MHWLRHDEQEQSYQHRWVVFKSHCQPFWCRTVPCLFKHISIWILPKSNTSADTCIDSATTSKRNPINIVALLSNLTVNHSDVRPFLAHSNIFQCQSCPSQMRHQIHAFTPPRRARAILSTSLSCFPISLSTIRISDCSLPIQLHFNRSIYRNTHLQRFISVFKYGYKTEPAMKLLQ